MLPAQDPRVFGQAHLAGKRPAEVTDEPLALEDPLLALLPLLQLLVVVRVRGIELHVAQLQPQPPVDGFDMVAAADTVIREGEDHPRAAHRPVGNAAEWLILHVLKHLAQHAAHDVPAQQCLERRGVLREPIAKHEREHKTDQRNRNQPRGQQQNRRKAGAVGQNFKERDRAAAAAQCRRELRLRHCLLFFHHSSSRQSVISPFPPQTGRCFPAGDRALPPAPAAICGSSRVPRRGRADPHSRRRRQSRSPSPVPA